MVDALVHLIERVGDQISPADLDAATELQDTWDHPYSMFDDLESELLDCSRVRELARQELARRGLAP